MDKDDLIYVIKQKLDKKYKITVSYGDGTVIEEWRPEPTIELSRYQAGMILQALGDDEW